jgi:hypothetical protein
MNDPVSDMTFEDWLRDFRKLAKHFDVIVMHNEFYREYYDDGDSPLEAARIEAKARPMEPE